MNITAKLGGFALVLAAVFAVAVGAGDAVGPVATTEPADHVGGRDTDHADAPDERGGGSERGHGTGGKHPEMPSTVRRIE